MAEANRVGAHRRGCVVAAEQTGIADHSDAGCGSGQLSRPDARCGVVIKVVAGARQVHTSFRPTSPSCGCLAATTSPHSHI